MTLSRERRRGTHQTPRARRLGRSLPSAHATRVVLLRSFSEAGDPTSPCACPRGRWCRLCAESSTARPVWRRSVSVLARARASTQRGQPILPSGGPGTVPVHEPVAVVLGDVDGCGRLSSLGPAVTSPPTELIGSLSGWPPTGESLRQGAPTPAGGRWCVIIAPLHPAQRAIPPPRTCWIGQPFSGCGRGATAVPRPLTCSAERVGCRSASSAWASTSWWAPTPTRGRYVLTMPISRDFRGAAISRSQRSSWRRSGYGASTR